MGYGQTGFYLELWCGAAARLMFQDSIFKVTCE